MSKFNIGDEVWFFQFIDSDKIFPLDANDIILCSEKYELIDEYSQKNCILGKTKNEAIDALIKKLELMKE